MKTGVETPGERFWSSLSRLRYPDRTALVDGETRWTFSDLRLHTLRAAAALERHGIRAGDRVALVAEPSAHLVACMHGATSIGAVIVPLGPNLPTAELAAALARVSPRILIAGPECHATAMPAVATGRRLESPEIVSPESLLQAGGPGVEPRVRGSTADSVHSIVFTSGSTGSAKAAMLTYANYQASAVACAERLATTENDVWLAPMPLHHVGGLSILLRSLVSGFCVVLLPRFDPVRTLEVLASERVTIVSVVPTMLHAMLAEHDDRADAGSWRMRFPSLRVVLAGGGPLPERLAERAKTAGVPLSATYGLTETASQATTATVAETSQDPSHCGRAISGMRVRIRDADADGFGTICVSGPQVFAGYFGEDASRPGDFDGAWFVTGDIGSIDAEGRLRVAMRREDRIVTGGENVSPVEVERVLCEHPDVDEAGVYPVADDQWGQIVAAAVVMRPGGVFDAESLDAWCRARLASFKVPRRFELRSALPRTAAGKLRRFLLEQDSAKR